ncbi:MAG: glycosyltransferase [Deltaproteobacteria bacterium]|nr:glycosyltransferase [Deltaproteobacteria bacterium]MBZ0219962.1 glycosyltransferase [Deltaproteobacteria bacterium]
MRISVIICTYNRSALLKDSMRSIMGQDFPKDRYEIVVVDNNSNDSTKEVVEGFAASSPVRIKYVFERRQGLSNARNTGVRHTEGEIIVFTDDDIEADPSWLKEYDIAFKDPEVYAAGGPLRPVWPGKRPEWLTDEFLGFIAVSEFREARRSGNEFKDENDNPWGANMAFRRDAFDEFGGFPEDLGRKGKLLLSNEEILLCRTIRRKGRRIVLVPGAVVHHKISKSRLSKRWFCQRFYWQGRSDAVLGTALKTYPYAHLRFSARDLSMQRTAGVPEFVIKCHERYAIGFLHQLLVTDPQDDFRVLRALETFAGFTRKRHSIFQAFSRKLTAPMRAFYGSLKGLLP